MENFKFEILWSLMKFNFEKENNSDRRMLCLLCKNVMVNSQCAPCGCRYCLNCILKYLDEGKKCCPGNLEICKYEIIEIGENVFVDHSMNAKISKILLKCPAKSCKYRDVVEKLTNHINICDNQLINCPYLNVGCNKTKITRVGMRNHFQSETVRHTTLLLNSIDNLNNEMTTLKIIVGKLREENKYLKYKINEINLDEKEKQAGNIESTSVIIHKEEIERLKMINNRMEGDLEKLKSNEKAFEELQIKCDGQSCKIDLLNAEIGKLRNVDKSMREDVDKLEEMNKELIEALKKTFYQHIEQIEELNSKYQQIENKQDDVTNELKLDGVRKEKALKRKCDEQTCKIDLLNAEIEKLRNVDKKSMREFADKLEEMNKELIGGLNKKCEQQNEQIEQLNNKYQQMEFKFVIAKEEREKKEKDLIRESVIKEIEMKTMSDKIDEKVKNVENRLLEKEINQKLNDGEFVWRIDKIDDKMKEAKNGINTDIYSNPFYTHKHGYKMCLSVNPDGRGDRKGSHLSVYFHLIRGEFDDILQWPFKHDVTISLINQQTGLAHVSKTAKYDKFPNHESYNKPIDERNKNGRGFRKFIKLNELSTNANLMLTNQIFIKCSVNISP